LYSGEAEFYYKFSQETLFAGEFYTKRSFTSGEALLPEEL
jgi:hypothetical protein